MAGSIERDQIIDQYKIQNLAGQDQFRDYYSAYEIDTGKPVTLSVLRQEYVVRYLNQDYLHRTQSLIQIRHPNLITYLQTGVLTDSRPYATVEPVSGFPLTERLERLAQEQEFAHATYALTLVQQIASGLVLLERLNLYHYELTPDHVLLRSVTVKNEESVVVTDLDIPSRVTAEFSDGSEFTTAYLSPEQLAGKDIDGRSHVYSLGVMLHELLCGQVPEQPITPWRKMWSSFRGGSTLVQKRPNLSSETYSLVERSLYKNKRSRFSSLEEFLEALENALAIEEAPGIATTDESTQRPRRFYLVPMAMLVICIILGLLGLRFSSAMRNSPETSVVNASEDLLTAGATSTMRPPDSSPTPQHTATPLPSLTPTEQLLRRTSTAAGKLSDDTTAVSELYGSPTPSETATAEPTATASATPTPIPSATLAPTNTPNPTFRILTGSANVRLGPGTIYDPAAFVYQGESLEIIGRSNGEFIWLNVQTEAGVSGWVAVDVGELSGPTDIWEIPIAATIPPLPTPTMTSTPTRTPLPPTPLPPSSSGSDGVGGGGNGGGNNDKPRATPTPPL